MEPEKTAKNDDPVLETFETFKNHRWIIYGPDNSNEENDAFLLLQHIQFKTLSNNLFRRKGLGLTFYMAAESYAYVARGHLPKESHNRTVER